MTLPQDPYQRVIKVVMENLCSKGSPEDNPVNEGELPDYNAFGIETSADESVGIFLKIELDKIIQASFVVEGPDECRIAAGTVARMAHGKSLTEAQEIAEHISALPNNQSGHIELALKALRKAIDDYISFKEK